MATEFGNFCLEVQEEDFQSILDFDQDFNELLAVSSLPNYADFLLDIGKSEFDELPPPELPTSSNSVPENPAKKRFRSISEETLQQYEDMNQSEQTKKNTKWGMKILQDWHIEKYGGELDLKTAPVEELAEKLGKFYCEARPQEQKHSNTNDTSSGEYHKNTLKNLRSAINRHLSDINRNVDIVNDNAFKHTNNKLNGLLKSRMASGNSVPTRHKDAINSADLLKIGTYLETASDNPIKLRLCVWYCVSMHFVSRGLEFHHQLNKNSFVFKVDENGREYAALSHETQQKNYQGGLSNMEDIGADKRMYSNPDSPSCPVKMLKFFISKTDQNATKLFNHCLKDAIISPTTCDIWYTEQSLGKNTFRNFLPDISQQSGCSKRYTAHCLRATAIQSLSNAGFETRQIMYMSGHRNEASVRSYARDFTTNQKQSISTVLSKTTSGKFENTSVAVPISKAYATSVQGQGLCTTPSSMNASACDVRSAIAAGILSNSTFNNCSINLNVKL